MNISVNANQTGGFDNCVSWNPGHQNTKEQRKTLFAGDIQLTNDPVEQRKKLAQKQALKVVRDAWENDQTVNQSIEERRSHYYQMKSLNEEAMGKVKRLSKEEQALQEQYGVSDDSKEQQDLELLEKYQDYKNGVTTKALTEEEMERVSELSKEPLTEYQKRALELNAQAGKFKIDARDAKMAMKDDVADVKSILLEKLKSNPMLDAQKTAEEIWEAANADIVSMAVEDAVAYIEEKMEEQEEKAEKSAEKQEEKDEQLEELKEKRALEKALIEKTKEAVERAEAEHRRNESPDLDLEELLDATKMNQQSSDVKASLNEIKNSMNLLEADLMGVKVDEEI
ncbi:MAG: HD-GYP domain protein [Roseburia sp.]